MKNVLFTKKTILLFAAFVVFALNGYAQNHGYKGYVDAGYSIGIGDYEFGRIEVNTSHGYQFNPYFFLGAGTGVHFMSSYETIIDVRDSKVDIPVFANIRCNFSKKKISPFIDFKGGTFVTNNGGLYLNGSVGCRFALNESQAVNIAIGYALEKLEFENVNYKIPYSTNDTEAITLKIGFEF